jgi:ribonuclease HI
MADPGVLTIHTDGASRGNPGAAAYAYVIARNGLPPIEEAGCLGEMTNNQAEYTALVKALEHALELGLGYRVLLHSDSELMVKQMNGEYQVKNAELRPLYEQAQQLARSFDGPVTIRHVRRGHNSRADALCNEALDGRRLPTPQGEPPVVAPRPSLHDEAVACLRQAREGWSAGQDTVSPEALWGNLRDILQRHGVRVIDRDV